MAPAPGSTGSAEEPLVLPLKRGTTSAVPSPRLRGGRGGNGSTDGSLTVWFTRRVGGFSAFRVGGLVTFRVGVSSRFAWVVGSRRAWGGSP